MRPFWHTVGYIKITVTTNILFNTNRIGFLDEQQSQEVMTMLVLTRKPAEMIQIGDDIVIKVIKTAKGTVKIGIEAPDDVRVIRGELLDQVKAPIVPEALVAKLAEHFEVLSDQYPHVA